MTDPIPPLNPGQSIPFSAVDGAFPEISVTLRFRRKSNLLQDVRDLITHGSTQGDLDLSAVVGTTADPDTDPAIITGTNRRWGPIRHSGDNLTGHGALFWRRNEPGIEMITVPLAELKPTTSLVFTVTSNAFVPLAQFEDLQCELSIRLGDPDDSEDFILHTLELSASEYDTAAIVAKLSYQEDAWVLEAINDTGGGSTAQHLLYNANLSEDFPNPIKYL